MEYLMNNYDSKNLNQRDKKSFFFLNFIDRNEIERKWIQINGDFKNLFIF